MSECYNFAIHSWRPSNWSHSYNNVSIVYPTTKLQPFFYETTLERVSFMAFYLFASCTSSFPVGVHSRHLISLPLSIWFDSFAFMTGRRVTISFLYPCVNLLLNSIELDFDSELIFSLFGVCAFWSEKGSSGWPQIGIACVVAVCCCFCFYYKQPWNNHKPTKISFEFWETINPNRTA